MKSLLQEIKKYEEEILSARRYLHQNPELHTNLPLTTKYVMDKLTQYGYEPKEICEAGVVAIAGGKKPGKTFLLRGDMDALPIKEETDLDFKSINDGKMHACGHDMHTAMMLGAAKLLKDHEDEIEGTVKLMFQPGEETLSGAKLMIESGLLENPTVDKAMMIHVVSGYPMQNGAVIFLGKGPATANVDVFEINIQGKGGHGAMPDTTIDPLNVLAHLHIALAELNSREVEPGEVAVLTIGEMKGGNAPNIIPDTAYMKGTIRTYNKKTREFMNNRLEEISRGIASTFRCTATVKSQGCPSVINDEELFDDTIKYTTELIGKDAVVDVEKVLGKGKKINGSEDFGFVSEKVPTLMLAITASLSKDGAIYPQHHPKVMFDESVLSIGAAVYANTAIEWLKEHQ
ncbi:M20 metallopeptidase family protein [Clostridium sp. DL1XJH146]